MGLMEPAIKRGLLCRGTKSGRHQGTNFKALCQGHFSSLLRSWVIQLDESFGQRRGKGCAQNSDLLKLNALTHNNRVPKFSELRNRDVRIGHLDRSWIPTLPFMTTDLS